MKFYSWDYYTLFILLIKNEKFTCQDNYFSVYINKVIFNPYYIQRQQINIKKGIYWL